MNKRLMAYALIMLFGTFISSVAQVLLKKAAGEKHDSILNEYLNLKVIIAYTIFFCSTFLCIFAYRVVPLSMGPILEATGYIYVTVFGIVIFGEKINRQKILALVLIITGIVVYSVLG